MVTTEQVEQGRAAYQRRSWGDAYEQLAAAEATSSLEAADLERLGTAAYLTGRDDAAAQVLERAHHAYLSQDEVARSVRCAFWLGIMLVLRGQHGQGGGWLARAQRLVEERIPLSVEQGYLLVPAGLQALGGGEADAAYETFGKVAKIAEQFGDADLMALGQLGRGQALVAMGKASQGVAMLDEAMVGVTTGDVSTVTAGIVYCSVIIACREIFDLRRAQEWTAALSRWCSTQPGLKPYRGQCLVHRSEIMQLHGQWADAMAEIWQACEHLSGPAADPVMRMAQYQRAELLRLRGELADAEAAYREAGSWGHQVHPGMALLRLAQGRIDDARAAIRRVVADAAQSRVERSKVLAAHVQIALAAGDADEARTAADDLERAASDFDSPYLRAVAGTARGAVLLAAGDHTAACATLRRAWVVWQELDAPYEAARVRVLMARACRALGDHDTAEMELDAARRVFDQLGAVPELTVIAELSRRAAGPSEAGGLSACSAASWPTPG